MASNDTNEEKLEVINFKLNKILSTYLRNLKEYYEINSTTEMIRFLIAQSHREIILKKSELKLDSNDIRKESE